ncbi:MAG: hypothetical protein QM500_08830 [Methylococcales bacterium]
MLDDWDKIYIDGLLLLSMNKYQEAKKILLNGHKKTPFKPMKKKFSVSLALARNSLGEHKAALKTIKNIDTSQAIMQKIIVSGELGQHKDVAVSVDKLRALNGDSESNVLNLLEARYLRDKSKNAQNEPELSQIISDEIREMLLVA